MHVTTAYAAILAFATTALATPVELDPKNIAATALANPVKRDPNTFGLWYSHYFQTGNCIPTVGCQPVNYIETVVHDDCNGGGCNGNTVLGLSPADAYCDVDFEVCGRTMRIVWRSDGDCREIRNLSPDNNGEGYGVAVENGVDVANCYVDFKYSDRCVIFAGSVENESRVSCFFM
ncbi:hypothetical protein BDW02DRAFT_564527 [Decorospora gaudefroyi]|uniref:Uncharacterized protein n=1 Tax=Decorospora gaudefroyi TaxID=184978 RepID=A0A6A5KS00_9PLEO|nr:hypothetical protein BDW02DRAFT_564527 [Decorospora gaudefroyi]